MAPPAAPFARRGGKVHSSQRTLSPPQSGRRGGGLGLGKGIAIRRKIKVPKDNIFGITKGDIRRLARRGGVKRISAGVYDTARQSLVEFLRDVPLLLCLVKWKWACLTSYVDIERLQYICRPCETQDSCRRRCNLCAQTKRPSNLWVPTRKPEFQKKLGLCFAFVSGCFNNHEFSEAVFARRGLYI